MGQPESGEESIDRPDRGGGSVRETYDRIAGHFAETRAYPWPEVESFLDDTPPGEVGLDVGCGNGRHAELLAEQCEAVVGLDASRGLLRAADDRLDTTSARLVQGDAARLPLRDASVAVVVYIATLHHLGTREDRRRSLDELARVLTPEGRGLVSAWSVAADRFDADEGFDTTVDWTLPDGETVDRFYHIYDPAEFRADVAASCLELVDFELSNGNCYGIVRST